MSGNRRSWLFYTFCGILSLSINGKILRKQLINISNNMAIHMIQKMYILQLSLLNNKKLKLK